MLFRTMVGRMPYTILNCVNLGIAATRRSIGWRGQATHLGGYDVSAYCAFVVQTIRFLNCVTNHEFASIRLNALGLNLAKLDSTSHNTSHLQKPLRYLYLMYSENDPLTGPIPQEIPLLDAPLVRVIAQLRFPAVLNVETKREFVAPFQEALRQTYPVLRQEQAQEVAVEPGSMSVKQQLVWRFSDLEGHWRVSLASGFVALETTRYTSRADFIKRLRQVLEALEAHVQPSLADRLGIRYIDRIEGNAVDEIVNLVRPEVRGILGTGAATHAIHSLSESMFELPDARVVARWGRLPPGASVDPSAIEPVNKLSWILDLDMSSVQPRPFDVDALVSEAQGFVERIYGVFRWAVTDDFLRRYGGKL